MRSLQNYAPELLDELTEDKYGRRRRDLFKFLVPSRVCSRISVREYLERDLPHIKSAVKYIKTLLLSMDADITMECKKEIHKILADFVKQFKA